MSLPNLSILKINGLCNDFTRTSNARLKRKESDLAAGFLGGVFFPFSLFVEIHSPFLRSFSCFFPRSFLVFLAFVFLFFKEKDIWELHVSPMAIRFLVRGGTNCTWYMTKLPLRIWHHLPKILVLTYVKISNSPVPITSPLFTP